ADARVEARDATGRAGADGQLRVALRFVIRPQVVVAGVEFDIGADAGTEITEDELRSRVTLLEPGKRLTELSLRENADAVQVYLRDRGFYRAEVAYEQQLDSSRTRATVLFRVRPGAPTQLESFNINIKGFDPAPVRPDLKLQTNAPFSQAALGEDIARIRQAIIAGGNLAPSIEEPDIRLDSAANRISVSLAGSIGPRVDVRLEGYELSEKRQRELLPIKREGSIEYSAIVEGERRIRNRLQEEGYFFADVTPSCTVTPPLAPPPDAAALQGRAGEPDICQLINPDELASSQVTINYEVARGRRFKLTDIRIEGTNKLAVEDVADDLRSREANLLGILPIIGGFGRGYTSQEALERDAGIIRARMRDLGYRRADVNARQGVTLEGENLIITFEVAEGPLTRVAGIETRGNQIYTATQLGDMRCPADPLPDESCLITGGPFSRTAARSDGERIRANYARNGYIDAEVQLSVDDLPLAASGDEQVRLVYNVKESDKVFIRQIFVNGVVQTKKEAVLEAIPLREGDVLRGDDLAESERILLSTTDAFRQVLIRTEDAGETAGGFKRKDVIIDVEERKSITTEYIIGFSTDTGALGGFELRNTNLRGTLRQGAIRTRFSRVQQLA
ncbi:MAG: hypothetical protein H7Z38_10595, partial [Rubrivivax sp.]|nr:hypothetical protein [Pyrinomonadaceae bacterium]